MSATSELVGGGYQFAHNGKTYTLKLIDQEVKDAFERAVFDKETALLKSMRDLYDKDEFAQMREQLRQDKIKGRFSLAAEKHNYLAENAATAGPVLFAVMLEVSELDALKLLAACKDDLLNLFQLAWQESFPDVQFEFPKDGETPLAQGT